MLDVIMPAPGGRTDATRDIAAHDGGRVGCNHAGGRCSELTAEDVGHDLSFECTRPACECHRLARPCGAVMQSGLTCVIDAAHHVDHVDRFGLRNPSRARVSPHAGEAE